jgi:hypothetical protein
MDEHYNVEANKNQKSTDYVPVILVLADTVQEKHQSKPMVGLCDSGSTITWISRSALPKGAVPYKVARQRLSTKAGTFESSLAVRVSNILFPEFSRSRRMEHFEARIIETPWGGPSIEEDDDDSLSDFSATASPLRLNEKQKSDQAQEELRRPSIDRDLISRPSIDSSDSLGEEKSGKKADYDWQALCRKEKQRLDLDENLSDEQRLDLDKNQDAVERRKPPPHSDIPIYSACISHINARTGVLDSGKEKLKLTKSPAASSRMQELIGRFEHAASPRIQDLIGRFERQGVCSDPKPKPTIESPRKARRSERESRQDVGERVNSIYSSFSSSADVFAAGHPRTSPAPHSFFWRSHPRVESSESMADMPSVSTVACVKVNPQFVDTSRSADTDSEGYTVPVDSSFDSKHMADLQAEPSIQESISCERRFL